MERLFFERIDLFISYLYALLPTYRYYYYYFINKCKQQITVLDITAENVDFGY